MQQAISQNSKQNTPNNQDLENPYVRFMFSIKSPETKKRYRNRLKTFLDYIQVPEDDIEERLGIFYKKAKENPQ
ncbi:MAG TPA: hypothetical protein VN704_06190 [Verrucomicrobiae bacterium]|nr:hypothetical protein [Verrucomicrobiae bacterium]